MREFLLESVGGVLEEEEVKPDVGAKGEVTDLVTLELEEVRRGRGVLAVAYVLLYAAVGLEEGLLDHGVAALGGLVLDDGDFAVDWVAVLSERLVFRLDV